MSLKQLETAVAQLPESDLNAFAQWFEEFLADEWDRKIEADLKAGKLNKAIQRADADFDAGLCKPL